MSSFDPSEPTSADFRDQIAQCLTDFLAGVDQRLNQISPLLAPLQRLTHDFTAGGKRLRPAFAYWGYAAVAGQPQDPAPLLNAVASFELLHVSALVHDDVMDASDTRRGLPAAHRQLEQFHHDQHGSGDAAVFGQAGAILLGDLMAAWSVEQVEGAGLPAEQLTRARWILDDVRTAVNAGQFLDMAAESGLTGQLTPLEVAERVVEYKTARYTVIRPLQFGGALAGASQKLLDQFAAIGSPLGRAFQFRDDVLGVFGDEEVTGKPAGDDLREGKRTVLVAEGLAAEPRLADYLGRELSPDELATARGLLESSGALGRVEERIESDAHQARQRLAECDITAEGATALSRLIDICVHRVS